MALELVNIAFYRGECPLSEVFGLDGAYSGKKHVNHLWMKHFLSGLLGSASYNE
jgi:hypothetical protein